MYQETTTTDLKLALLRLDHQRAIRRDRNQYIDAIYFTITCLFCGAYLGILCSASATTDLNFQSIMLLASFSLLLPLIPFIYIQLEKDLVDSVNIARLEYRLGRTTDQHLDGWISHLYFWYRNSRHR